MGGEKFGWASSVFLKEKICWGFEEVFEDKVDKKGGGNCIGKRSFEKVRDFI